MKVVGCARNLANDVGCLLSYSPTSGTSPMLTTWDVLSPKIGFPMIKVELHNLQSNMDN